MNKLQAILIAGLLSLTSVSFASTFNFFADANGNEHGALEIASTIDGITVTASGSNSSVAGPIYAYLDDGAGLGVCSTGLTAGDQCVDSSDDNVTNNETLKLVFDTKVRFDELSLLDYIHNTTGFNGDFDIKVDGALLPIHTALALSASPSVAGLTGKIFEFINNGGGQGYEFYIADISVTAVPVPAAGILFASALFGAGAFGRRKKKAKASVVGAFARAS